MGNFTDWFGRSYKGIIIGLLAVFAGTMVVLAMQHVNNSRPAAGATARPAPTFASSLPDKPRAVFFGDSYVEGTGASTPAKRWTTLVAQKEGWIEINLGQGGTGYVNGGPDQGQADQYASRIAKIKAARPDIVVIAGSQNDLLFPTDQVDSAIKDTLVQIRAAVPDAKIVVYGPVNPGEIKPATRTNDAATSAAAQAIGADYISSISPTSTYESPADYWTDGQHPSDSGHQHIADRFIEELPSDVPRGEPSASPTAG
ncbi:hypothetical protein GCM10009706_14420 [Curtobacterium citreum]|uniref:SGNH/GDSL hydrolase family protein n=1 Tax=Curtobacterium citreum TaxID=2036 RepID=A0ABT2HDJ0_9MICO|nr:SGNH/GDSL hydrolase family protein [Curtobacterium citreum]MCS6521331.1 SGNH/GDSL hydrolase family protein [Curtobacterium citreum]TQJ28190.1 lysophospholipase L1-like esterase [Curtobacterium citreum]GGL77083.1 hypothetical protein GCM10009706_14420 [Curtobacterium citreum]